MRVVREIVKALLRQTPFKALRQRRFLAGNLDSGTAARPLDVLVLGVYLARRPHHAVHLSKRFAASGHELRVEQRWTGLDGISDDPALRVLSQVAAPGRSTPKFALINRMLRPGDLDAYDFIIVCDDDILVPGNFLAAFLSRQSALGWAVAQPARTLYSHFDHLFAGRRPWLQARRTWFVECGPLISFRRDAARLLMPDRVLEPEPARRQPHSLRTLLHAAIATEVRP